MTKKLYVEVLAKSGYQSSWQAWVRNGDNMRYAGKRTWGGPIQARVITDIREPALTRDELIAEGLDAWAGYWSSERIGNGWSWPMDQSVIADLDRVLTERRGGT